MPKTDHSRRRAILVALATLVLPVTGNGMDFPVADLVIVEKAKRKLHLVRDGEAFRTFDIALGISPVGDKTQEGDFRTPEGRYILDSRNPNSEYFLSIHVSYPNPQDLREARARGVEPGGAIMIHGQPNEPTYSEAFYRTRDWTNGCIAVSNSDMIDIWLMTGENTPIEIRP
ncbi:MAG: L,D-transpeptidase family protein [Woeseiaceae bacterium]|nr:L,D-transpeptidase family protein [Woeseiaceae bacterium]